MFGFKKKPDIKFISAVIVAAGTSSRMNGIDKQKIEIDEIPVVVHSITSFMQSPSIKEIILVCSNEYIADYFALMQEFSLTKVSSVVGGGDTRQASVFFGDRRL